MVTRYQLSAVSENILHYYTCGYQTIEFKNGED